MCDFCSGVFGPSPHGFVLKCSVLKIKFTSIIAVHIYVTMRVSKVFYFDKFFTLNMFSRVHVSWIE